MEQNNNPHTKVAFHTLGCKLNFSESSYIAKTFLEHGYEIVDFKDTADLYVVHSCTVTAIAEKKCRNLIRSLKTNHPDAKIAVIGCYSEIHPETLEVMPEVDFICGNFDKYDLINRYEKAIRQQPENDKTLFVPTFSSGDRTRSFLKVQDGCDYFCTYCAVPYARGRSRSNTIAETLKITREAINSGCREIVLTGVNVGDFGKHHGETFLQLIQAMDQIEWEGRFRLSSIEPELMSDETIDFVADSNRFMPHFHLPLQAGSDAVLEAMHRRYRTDLFAERVERIRQKLPLACIAVDVIAGFSTETDADFETAYRFIEKTDISYLHVFTYSERPETPAAKIANRVPVHLRRERSQQLQQLSEQKKTDFYRRNIGQTEQVLFEADQHKGMMFGFTRNYIRVATPYRKEWVNKTIDVPLEKMEDDVFLF
ncbi:MAG: tRNA (N(6)-L-threonylcarbamoyladenosine(37)-C(2))-methylthiotransferase MtaB [Bacteroidales bacterium]|nr:tRNA (N(6)-L-threonylcarbamoyladenosine(37)-C(2))-methylthiotransferase MtaB [Bacteroidales bacterium]